ncbi:hypothetical protein BBC27_01220 [Acidithiobacillus ferrivorans]|uniref:Uncharacterized protein n=1 Tax=Acidithiobacillus ferrivorans TaxID=160808 RepID=A0A1B9BW69_9PROT|nr:hypothetical protein BBC27_01220 [Acidithiobacillus ferrivorans]
MPHSILFLVDLLLAVSQGVDMSKGKLLRLDSVAHFMVYDAFTNSKRSHFMTIVTVGKLACNNGSRDHDAAGFDVRTEIT